MTRRSSVVAAAVVTLCAAACGAPSPGDDDSDDDDGGTCTEGARRCRGNVLESCSGGVYQEEETCPAVCDATFGCTACLPNTGVCEGDTSHACRPDGSGTVDVYCDPVQGMSCGTAGVCEGACSSIALGLSYVGCDYWPTITGNIVSSYYDFAVAVSNTSMATAQVVIEGGALTAPRTFEVPPQRTVVERLPWVAALKFCVGANFMACQTGHATAALAADGAYHLRSTAPITVYQFNALDFFKPGASENSFSNDASLLFPTNAWRDEYYVSSYDAVVSGPVAYPSLLAVAAYQDDTAVTITTRAATAAQNGAPAFAAGVPQTVTLDSGDVLEVGAAGGDLTGSYVTADKPIQVIGGHYCANVPLAFSFCDHLEQSMFPVDALSNRYVVVAPATQFLPGGKEQTIRVVATRANTTLTYEPPIAGAPTTIAAPGDFIEIPRTPQNFLLMANQKVLVAQYMEGSTVGGGIGDPSMSLAVPIEQYRTEYLFHAPTNYTLNYVDIIAPLGAAVTLDGLSTITNFSAIGTSGFGFARLASLGNGPANDGNHSLTASVPFGISVYGYGQDTSYWYPGGLDLKPVPISGPPPAR